MGDTSSKSRPQCVIAIGGSAGALSAFERFFKAVPEDLNAAFVVLQHMDPGQKSLLPELLARMSRRPVHPSKNGQSLMSGHVYVIEPGTTLGLADGAFVSRPNVDLEERRHPIDHFFGSLASQYGSHAVGIVVSGTGTDGTHGLRQIQNAGGRTLVQSPSEAKFDGMPRSAIEAAVVDRVLPIEKLAQALAAFVECADSPWVGADATVELASVCEVLLRRTGHDFSSYKKSTVARRVERRLQANLMPDLTAYIEFLEKDHAEPRALLRDLLISVTRFFRDPDAFEALRESIVPRLFDQVRKGESLRVWVPACATGEEAYSIAILLREFQRIGRSSIALQIFATDIDRSALEFARRGEYPESIVEQVPSELLSRYFSRTKAGFQTNQELREICIFSEHSLLRNPPFSRIDLVSCRNLFIYFEPELQSRIIPLFHYALNPRGLLFLGPAENIAGTTDLFKTVDKKHRIFARSGSVSRSHVVFPMARSSYGPPLSADTVLRGPMPGDRDMGRSIFSTLLESFAPPAFVITELGELVFYSGKTGKYIEPNTGVPNHNIFDMISRQLRSTLHALLHRCVQSQAETSQPGVSFETEGFVQAVKLSVRPIEDGSGGPALYLVVLQELMPVIPGEAASQEGIEITAPDSIVRQLEDELRQTREHLQRTIEEVKSSNEELLSMNEELQSANEELQSSKEELQSTNEEMETVNSELSRKVEELDTSNSDLQNFFQGAQVPILFLDREFRIQKFTPAATRIFRLIPTDLGRAISDISSFLEAGDLGADFIQVLGTLQPLERELGSRDGAAWYIMRVSPYRTINNVIAGVVVTFSDVTELKNAQGSRSALAAIVESSTDAIVSQDLTGKISSWNAAAEKLFTYTAAEAAGKAIEFIIPEDRREETRRIQERVLSGELVLGFDTVRMRKDGCRIDVSTAMSPIRDERGHPLGFSVIYRDVSARNRADELIRNSHEQLRDVLESMSDAFVAVGSDGIIQQVNAHQERLSGLTREYQVGKSFLEIFFNTPELKKTRYWSAYRQAMEERVVAQFLEFYAPLELWTEVRVYPKSDGGLAIFSTNANEKKKAEKEFREAGEQFKTLADAMPNLAWIAEADGAILWYNRRWFEYTGTTPAEMEGWGWQSVHHPEELPRVLEAWRASIASGDPFEMTFPLKGGDGRFKWFLTRVNPLKDPNGKVVRWFGTNTDVDEQKRSREALKESEERLSFALAAARMGIFDWSVVTGRLEWSDQMARLHGIQPGSFKGTFEHTRELTHPDDHVRVMGIIEQSVKAGSTFEAEYRVIWPMDQSVHWLYAYGRSLADDQGRPFRSIGAVLDITERKRIEKELEAAVQTRDEFLSVASHELKTPLTSLKLQAQLRKRRIAKQDSSAFTLENISKMVDEDERQIKRLTRLIDDMLDIARISSGKLTVHPQPVDLCVIVHEVAERFRESLEAANCRVSIEACEPVMGEWDRFRIEQVVTNLLTNAVKYGPGKPIHLRVESDGLKARLRVQDEGMGIDPTDQQRIFKQFERAIDTNEVSGLGLGLYIVKQILDAHGGSIEVESEIGKGARFTVELPLRASAV